MSYQLIGSHTSPFARRLRLLMSNLEYQFVVFDILSSEGLEKIRALSPVGKIPVLIHDETIISDSNKIFYYLNELHHFEVLTPESINLHTKIESLLDSGVSLLYLQRSNMLDFDNNSFVIKQRDRIKYLLNHIKTNHLTQLQSNWNFSSMSFYSFLDWSSYRGILDQFEIHEFHSFIDMYKSDRTVTQTTIPKGL